MNLLEMWLTLLFLGSSMLVGFKTALMRLGMTESDREIQKHPGYYRLLLLIRKTKSAAGFEALIDLILIEIQVYRLIVVMVATYDLFITHSTGANDSFLLLAIAVTITAILLAELTMRLIAVAFPLFLFKCLGFPASLMLILLFPAAYPVLHFQQRLLKKKEPLEEKSLSKKFQQQLREFLQNMEIQQRLLPLEKKLLLATASFRDRLAREIMVPRQQLLAISDNKTILDCAKLCSLEGFSRIPVYKDTIDHIIGIVLSKDLLHYLDQPELLSQTIQPLIKPIIFTPETKKISNLLQEFKTSRIHLAIVVNEYGGTEGIVTIEDILEQLVGEIEDEYDVEKAKQFQQDDKGAYLMDGKTLLIDIANELKIEIPLSPTYDTIGGFIISMAGYIPQKGWKMHDDTFFIEIVASDEKSIDKVKVMPSIPSK
jgi:putative hemolysin